MHNIAENHYVLFVDYDAVDESCYDVVIVADDASVQIALATLSELHRQRFRPQCHLDSVPVPVGVAWPSVRPHNMLAVDAAEAADAAGAPFYVLTWE